MLPKWGKVKKSTAQSLCGANLFLSIEINGNNLDDLLHNKRLLQYERSFPIQEKPEYPPQRRLPSLQ